MDRKSPPNLCYHVIRAFHGYLSEQVPILYELTQLLYFYLLIDASRILLKFI